MAIPQAVFENSGTNARMENQLWSKCAWRLLPLLVAANVVGLMDRVNVGFAALTMNRDLGFSPSVYGFGAGVLFVGYGLFQLPSNLALARIGARRWISFILASWGAASAACSLIQGPLSFYFLRFMVGAAEAGLVPGVLVYLSLWFHKGQLGRAYAIFAGGNGIALIIGGPLASLFLTLDGIAGLRPWQWLFLIEGLLPAFLSIAVLLFLPDRPAAATFLSPQEKEQIARRIRQDDVVKNSDLVSALRDPRIWWLGIAHGCFLVTGYGLNIWLPLVMQGIGFSNGATGILGGLISAAGLPVMYYWGSSSDRSGERIWHAAIPVLTICASLMTAAVMPASGFSIIFLAIAYVASQCWLGPFYSIPPLFLTGPGLAGGIAVAVGFANLTGGFAGQYLIGVLREQSGGYAIPFAMMAGVALLAAMIVLSLGRFLSARSSKQVAPA
jgi:ACS family tartrate transporter-like MFS transporter